MEKLWEKIENTFSLDSTIHGPEHWRDVKENGLLIAKHSGANVKVVELFALFHDSKRANDGWDTNHGFHGAEFAKEMRNELDITDEEFDLLYYACKYHTTKTHTDNITIGTCWDADRLDLVRLMVKPDPKFLNTDFAKELAGRIII